MGIRQLLAANPSLHGLDAAALATAINAKTIEQRNEKRRVPTDLVADAGVNDAAAAAYAFEQATASGSPLSSPLKSLIRLTVPAGINFASDDTRAILDAMVSAGLMASDLAARLKGLGRSYSSMADTIGGDVTQEACQTVLDEIAAEQAKAALLQAATARWNNVLAGIGDGSIESEADAILIFGA